MGLFSKFKAGLAKTHAKLTHEIKRIVTRSPKLTAESLEEIEHALIAADLGMAMTTQIVAAVKHAYETQGTAGLDYLAIARGLETKLSAGGTPAEVTMWSAQLFNNRVDAAVTGVFLVLVTIVVLANARTWYQLISGKSPAALREEPYVAVASESA